MEIPKILLAAITTTIIASSCTKVHDVKPTTTQQTGPMDTLNNIPRGDDGMFCCPGCGRG